MGMVSDCFVTQDRNLVYEVHVVWELTVKSGRFVSETLERKACANVHNGSVNARLTSSSSSAILF
jgi:hypothetical protein